MIPFETVDALLMNVLGIGTAVLIATAITLGVVVGIYVVIKSLYIDFKKTKKRSDNNAE